MPAPLKVRLTDGAANPVAQVPVVYGFTGDVPDGQIDPAAVSTDSAIRIRVDAIGDDTALAGIQRLVAEAQESRSRAQGKPRISMQIKAYILSCPPREAMRERTLAN